MDDLRALIAEPHRELINISAELVTAKWLLSEYREDHTGMVTRATMRKIRDQNDAARECALRLRKAADKLPGLLDRIAAVERDAERYRWLRANPNFMGWEHDFLPDQVDTAIDAAIDAARAAMGDGNG